MRKLALMLLLTGSTLVAQQLAPLPDSKQGTISPETRQLVMLANQTRAAAGVAPLHWDPALAVAAVQHCMRMATEEQIAHRFEGELEVAERAAQAGARFSLIGENVTAGDTLAEIHGNWMDFPEDRANLLNPEADSVGVAVVSSDGVIYAVAYYAHAVQVLSQAQVEAVIAGLLRAKGLAIVNEAMYARLYCADGTNRMSQSSYSFLWQSADLTQLPRPLIDVLTSGHFRKAAVGNCPTHDAIEPYTAYRVAVMLYSVGVGKY